jgi:hypothetical protein
MFTKQETTPHIWVAPDGDASRAKHTHDRNRPTDGFPRVELDA